MEKGRVWGKYGGDGIRWIKDDLPFSEKLGLRLSSSFGSQNVFTFSCIQCGYVERYVGRSK